ncbi:MAG: N-acyl-D-glucosamine 2-epimerase [Bacilli bacterium]|nr:N-acyl-D-glucosamine 2-epimerase [Bacilli bacterium]
MNLMGLKGDMQQELDRILNFWCERTIDSDHGGFIGALSNDLTVVPSANKGLVLHARIFWTFSRAYRMGGKKEHLIMAERALDVLETHFLDTEHGGYYWMLDAELRPFQMRKQIYGQAFVLYAYSEYILGTGRKELLPKIRQLVDMVERSYDPLHNGYFEAYTREWELEKDLRLSESDLNEKKSMNTHLHILEAYTNAFRVWPSSIMRSRLQNQIELMIEKMIDQSKGHFMLFFDEDWSVKSDRISFGHDIEGSWLLYEAAEVLGERILIDKARHTALLMASAVMNEGIDRDGALWNEADPTGINDKDKDWWPQAEAVVGFVNAWQLTGNQEYWDAAVNSWQFIKDHMIDYKNGEWFWKVNEQGVPYLDKPKVNEWKCPYHNSRACFEIIERLKND